MKRITHEEAKKYIPYFRHIFNISPSYFTVQEEQDGWEKIEYYTSREKEGNIYQQIVDMELQDLENELINIQNQLIGDYEILDEFWRYHPANPNFINPIKGYDLMKKRIDELENKLSDLELKINHLKSIN